MDAPLTLRRAGARDEAAVARVAALDSRRSPAGPMLIAELDGRVVAAISLDCGAVVADPFERTADIVQALRLRRRQLMAPADKRGGRRALRRLGVLSPATGRTG